MQENLDNDINRVFGINNHIRTHIGPQKRSNVVLSDKVIRNLKRFFSEDYELLMRLFCWGKVDREVFINII
jgi:hypothetical protein